MDNWAILATGRSLTLKAVESVRCMNAIAVSDAYKLAPWAYAMASQDKAWWMAHPEAMAFDGRKFTTADLPNTERFLHQAVSTGTNSGLYACRIAQSLGAKRIELHGFDMHGNHFFGQHEAPLKNTTEERFSVMIAQFASWNCDGIEVVNMTPHSALKCFPFGAVA